MVNIATEEYIHQSILWYWMIISDDALEERGARGCTSPVWFYYYAIQQDSNNFPIRTWNMSNMTWMMTVGMVAVGKSIIERRISYIVIINFYLLFLFRSYLCSIGSIWLSRAGYKWALTTKNIHASHIVFFSAVGIDLGTTFSVVGVNIGGKVVLVQDELGRKIFPSIVSYAEGGSKFWYYFNHRITDSLN